MTKITLQQMTSSEYDSFKVSTVKSFAAGNVTAGTWKQSGAENKAEAMLKQLLPDGNVTAGHRFYTITTDQENLGTLWVFVQGSSAFLFDIMLDKRFRGVGYGRQTMTVMEKMLADEGIREVELHVFGHNAPARALYQKIGYLETDITMKKKLPSQT